MCVTSGGCTVIHLCLPSLPPFGPFCGPPRGKGGEHLRLPGSRCKPRHSGLSSLSRGGSWGHQVGSALSRGLRLPHISHLCAFSGLNSAGRVVFLPHSIAGGGGIQAQPKPSPCPPLPSGLLTPLLLLPPGPGSRALPASPPTGPWGDERVLRDGVCGHLERLGPGHEWWDSRAESRLNT